MTTKQSNSAVIRQGNTELRRLTFMVAIALTFTVGSGAFYDLLWRTGMTPPKWCLFGLYTVLLGVISVGFWQSFFGLIMLLRGGDPNRITNTINLEDVPLVDLPRTAIVIPIYNEPVERVFAGVRAIYRSVQSTGKIADFDFFILSDSTDPNVWVEEEMAWVEVCRKLNANGKIFYRRRKANINRKSGNISDFCRRWGTQYDHMICLDADSLMSGRTIVGLASIMVQYPHVGLVQTVPGIVNAESLFARIQQFANRFHSLVNATGLNFWQQGEGNYWGHNAIIRLKPFIEHCALPDLPGREPLGGHILSHDFVEAALMTKAGYAVWLAHDWRGSFEETPPNIIENAKRDRRWCQGNLQHFWLLFTSGFAPSTRIHLGMGILSYVSSLLWLGFLLLSTLILFAQSQSGLTTFIDNSQFRSIRWSIDQQALIIFFFTLGLILIPKLLSLIGLLRDKYRRKRYGSWTMATCSVFGEVLFFSLLAPVNMILHSNFVLTTVLGKSVQWSTQNRSSDHGIDWKEAIATFKGQFVVALLWGALAWQISPALFAWLSPLLLGWLLAIPISVYSSRKATGTWAKRKKLFLSPEELDPPDEVLLLREEIPNGPERPHPIPEFRADYGLLRVVIDPYINAVHTSLLRAKEEVPESKAAYLANLQSRLLSEGATTLSKKDKIALLGDYQSCVKLHQSIWTTPHRQLAPFWRLAFNRYNRESLFQIDKPS